MKDESWYVRDLLRDGLEPDGWNGGFFELPFNGHYFDVQKFILDRTKIWDRDELLRTAEIDALRLCKEDEMRERKYADATTR